MTNLRFKWLVIICLLVAGCELYTQDDFREFYVVESYLVANRPLPDLRISKTLPLEEKYRFEEAALNDATAEIRRLASNGEVVEVFEYSLRESGIYRAETQHSVRPETRYELHIRFSNGDSLYSTTFVPGAFTTLNELKDDYIYQHEQIEITVEPSFYPGRQSYYVFSVSAQNTRFQNLTPFYRSLIEEQNADTSNFYLNSSGIVNEENYERDEEGNITLHVPWLAIAFLGNNDIIINAIDDNMYDFLRSQDVQTGGSTLPPGEIQNIHYNVEGGIGIFGSLASDTNTVFIRNPSQDELE